MAWRRPITQQWEAIRVHLPQQKPSSRGGRPRAEDRRCVEGILWTGAQWSELPRRYGSPSTCGRRLKVWEATGVLLKLWRAFLAQLNDQQKLRWDEGFADGSFIPAKKRAKVGKTKRGKGTKWLVMVDGAGTSAGSRPGRGDPGRSYAPRNDARHGCRRSARQAGAPPEAPRTTDRGSGR
jgi:transposase